MKTKLRIYWLLTLVFAVMLCHAMLCHAQKTARQWNSEVTAGWNLGNQFECSAPGQDGESMAIGEPDGADNAETAWGNPVVTKKTIKAVHDAGFNAIRIPVRWQCHITNPAAKMAMPHHQPCGHEHQQDVDGQNKGGDRLVSGI